MRVGGPEAEWHDPPFELTDGGHCPPQVFVAFWTVRFQQELRGLLRIVQRVLRHQQPGFVLLAEEVFSINGKSRQARITSSALCDVFILKEYALEMSVGRIVLEDSRRLSIHRQMQSL
jgi:hypothetical protein